MIHGLGPYPDFFNLDCVLAFLRQLEFLALLISEFSIIHDLTNRWRRMGRYLYQIKIMLTGFRQGICQRYNSYLFPLMINNPNAGSSDFSIYS